MSDGSSYAPIPPSKGTCTLYVGEKPQSDHYVCILPEKNLWAAGLSQWPPRTWTCTWEKYDNDFPPNNWIPKPFLDALRSSRISEAVGTSSCRWRELKAILENAPAEKPIVATLPLGDREGTMERLEYFTIECGMKIAGWFNNARTGTRLVVLVR